MGADRRAFLSGALAAAGLASGVLLPRQASAAARLDLEPLGPQLWRVSGTEANVVVAESADALLLVDGGAAAETRGLQKLLSAHFPGKPLQAVFNTHWHPSHSGFNATARKAGVDVIAHENTRLWLSTEIRSRWLNRTYVPQPPAALPNRTFYYGPQSLQFGGRAVEYVHLGQAHTDGDIYVRFPEANVIVAGGVVATGRYPLGDPDSNGWLGGIHAATKTLIARSDAATKIVPTAGAPVGIEALKEQAELCFTALQRMGDAYYKGQTFEELVAQNPVADYEARYGDPRQFLKLSWDTAWYHVGEIRRVSR